MPREDTGSPLRRTALRAVLVWMAVLAFPNWSSGQEYIQREAQGVITVSRGSSAILTRQDSIFRVSVADPEIAEPVVLPPSQVLINAKKIGSTSLIVWGKAGPGRLWTIEVTADIASLQHQMDELFPGAGLRVASTGTSVVLSGEVRDPSVVQKAIELATNQGIPVVDNVEAPAPEQILLHVQFAEITQSVLKELSGDLIRLMNPANLDHAFDSDDNHQIETLSGGFVNLMVEGDGSGLDAVIRALKGTGEFRSLAEPNLVTREGEKATFLAGGEFPFPTIQGGQNTSAVTITWKEFGIRLSFVPTITNAGNIRLKVAPEVSTLDFANGLTYEGFNIPAILARRVETDVELKPGQTLAIGGLLDNTLMEEVEKIPLLGDIPILGVFFRSKTSRQERTELLVLVTPHILDPDHLPAPPVPTGDPSGWRWDSSIKKWIQERPDSAGLVPVRRLGGGGEGHPTW